MSPAVEARMGGAGPPSLDGKTSAAYGFRNLAHDAHIAALMREHGVRRIYTRDADFFRFPFLEPVDPVLEAQGGVAETVGRYRVPKRRRPSR